MHFYQWIGIPKGVALLKRLSRKVMARLYLIVGSQQVELVIGLLGGRGGIGSLQHGSVLCACGFEVVSGLSGSSLGKFFI